MVFMTMLSAIGLRAQDTTIFYGFVSNDTYPLLVQVEPQTATIEPVGTITGVTSMDFSSLIVNHERHSISVAGADDFGLPRFFEIDLTDQSLLHTSTPMAGLEVSLPRLNPETGVVYALNPSIPARIISFDYETGQAEVLDTIAFVETASEATFMASTNEYLFIARNFGDPPSRYRLYSFNTESGELSGGTAVDLPDQQYVRMLYWDEHTDLVLATLVDDAEQNHQYVHLDEEGNISLLGYFIHAETINQHTRTVGQVQRQWIYQGQHIAQPVGHYTIFTHDMNTGDLLYSAETQTELLAMFAVDSGVPLAIDRPAAPVSFKIFPIPADRDLTFSAPLNGVRVMDSMGRVVLESQGMRSSLDVSVLPAGCYMLHGSTTTATATGFVSARFVKH